MQTAELPRLSAVTGSPALSVVTPVTDKVYWKHEINRRADRDRSEAFDLYRVISLARESLKHGEWSALWRDEDARYSKSKADKLASVGRWLRNLNAHTCEHLPNCWQTLRALSRLSPPFTHYLVLHEKITVGLTLVRARTLVERLLPKQKRRMAGSSNITPRIDWFCKLVRRTLRSWTPRQRRRAAQRLSALLQLLDQKAPANQIHLRPEPHPRHLSGSSCTNVNLFPLPNDSRLVPTRNESQVSA